MNEVMELSKAIQNVQTSLRNCQVMLRTPNCLEEIDQTTEALVCCIEDLMRLLEIHENNYSSLNSHKQEQFRALKSQVTNAIAALDDFSDDRKLALAFVALRRCAMDAWMLEGKEFGLKELNCSS
mgnify:CR=1 FL=1